MLQPGVVLLTLLSLIPNGQANMTYVKFDLTQYKQMPPMYQLDDYDLCLQSSVSRLLARSTYCLVYAEIVPNASSTLWQQVEEVSHDEKHKFRHDHLFVGVCLENCKRSLSTLSKFQVQQLREENVLDTQLRSYYAKVHKRMTDERLHYNGLINSCLNRHYGRQYAIRLRSSIEYCVHANEPLPHDSLDITVYALLAVIILFTVASTSYDFWLKQQQIFSERTNAFYQKGLQTQAQKILAAFSLCRNYYRLTQPHANELTSDLRFFDAFRVIGVFFVILGHTLLIFMTLPIQNPEFFEQFLHRFETSILQNGNTVIQIFFVMSGFLLYVNFTQRQMIKSKSSPWTCIVVYFRVFINRYFRLLPSLIILILFNGTILTRLQDGPFWRHITEAERVFCRENWWKNVLFVNNYLLEESCNQQTWYLAADTQLFELFLIILIITNKYPQLIGFFNVALLALAFSVPGLLTYFLKLEAVYHLRPETYRYLFFRNSETFYQIYPPFYTNLGGYLFGFLCGQFYLKVRSSNQPNRYKGKWKYELGMWLLVPVIVLILLSGYIFIKYDFEKPSIWLAVYAALHKNLWAMVCAGFVSCMCFKVGWIGYEFCTLPIFRPLSRLSFQAYLWHVVVLRTVVGYFRQPIYINSIFLFCNIILVFVLTQIVAFIVVLLIEYPLAEIIKVLLRQEKVAKKVLEVQDFSEMMKI